MSKFKKGQYSNYQISKSGLSSPKGGLKPARFVTEKSPNIYQINQLQNFDENTARVNIARAQMVQSVKEREEKIRQMYKNRVRLGLLFLNYKENPFLAPQAKKHLNQLQKEISKADRQKLNQIKIQHFYQQEKTIISCVNKLKTKETNTRFDNRLASKKIERLPMYNFSLERKQEKKKTPQKQKIITPFPIQENIVVEKTDQKIQKQQNIEDAIADLDRIVKMDDCNFFENRLKDRQINIFRILHLKEGKAFLKKPINILTQNMFCFESILKKLNSSSEFPVEEDILPVYKYPVKINRQSKLKEDLQMKNDKMMFKVQNIQFKQMIDLANGHIKPLDLKIFLNQKQKIEDEPIRYHNISFGMVPLPVNHRNASALNEMSNEHDYINSQPFTKRQEKQHQLVQTYVKQLRDILKLETTCLNSQIYDKKLRKKFKEKKDKILKDQIRNCQGICDEGNGRKKKITTLISEKDRRDNIKIKGLISTLKLKKIYETAHKSWSKTKNKTSRLP